MSTKNINVKTAEREYSRDYLSIRDDVEREWPAYKVSTYNDNFATSAHAKKVVKE